VPDGAAVAAAAGYLPGAFVFDIALVAAAAADYVWFLVLLLAAA
jgi:hypothetical protein